MKAVLSSQLSVGFSEIHRVFEDIRMGQKSIIQSIIEWSGVVQIDKICDANDKTEKATGEDREEESVFEGEHQPDQQEYRLVRGEVLQKGYMSLATKMVSNTFSLNQFSLISREKNMIWY